MSIAIPCYEMHGRGVEFLNRSLRIINDQHLDKNLFELVISDHSIDDNVKKCCKNFPDLNIKYFKNSHGRGSMSANLNNCILHSSGRYIKPIFQDDYLFSPRSLELIYNNIEHPWAAYEYIHFDENNYYNKRTPFTNDRFIDGINTLGPPTVISIINDGELFDENLSWFMDVEFYHRMMIKYGHPTIFKCDIPICTVTTWSGQTTQSVDQELIDKELSYIKYLL